MAWQWFADIGTSWRSVLAHSDDELGIAPAIGVPGGYRQRLCKALLRWESSVNRILRTDYDGCPTPVRVRILSTCSDDEVLSSSDDSADDEGSECSGDVGGDDDDISDHDATGA